MKKTFFAWIGSLAVAGVLYGHDTWLMPERFAATPGATLRFSLTSATGFIGPESAIKPERVERAFFRVGNDLSPLSIVGVSEKTLDLTATFGRPGAAVVAVDLKPRVLELSADKIELYFREIHAGDALRAAWSAIPEPRLWRERYTKHTKTFVRVGDLGNEDKGWSRPVGAVLEIIPERNPLKLKAGDTLSVVVLRNGTPMPAFALGFVAAGEVREHVVFTDKDGRAQAVLDFAGSWLIHGTDLRRIVDPELQWESDFTTMTVDVK